ncbi:tetratricopeptide repeat protein [uncultured Microscilla sp.]|uniref:tetratricopeptide repeat protein n=1 Tax=uncultured Microscilla sp. TaxID=432653 RepID=UPI0026240A82|nr:tetratricopeptide repeat protein [uncultured Microscilla sp.]
MHIKITYITIVFLLLSILINKKTIAQNQAFIDSLKQILPTNISEKQRVEVYNQIAWHYRRQDHTKAIQYSKKMLSLSGKINYPMGTCDAYYHLGVIRMIQTKYDKALFIAHKMLQLSKKIAYLKGQGNAYNLLSALSWHKEDYAGMIKFGKKSLKIRQQIDDKEGVAIIYRGILGTVYEKQGNYPKALEYFHKSLKVSEAMKSKKLIGFCYHRIAALHITMKRFSQAISFLKKSLVISRQTGDSSNKASVYIHLGNAYVGLKHYQKGIGCYEKSKKILLKIDEAVGLIESYLSIGKAYLKLGKYKKALYEIQQANQIIQKKSMRSYLPQTYVMLGSIYYYLKKYSKAVALLKQGLKLAKKSKNPIVMQNAAKYLALTYHDTKQFEKAYNKHVLLKYISDSLFNKNNAKKMAQIEASYTFGKKEDSLNRAQENERLVFEQEKKRHKLIQRDTYLGLALAFVLVAIMSFFYWEKRKNNRKLNDVNKKLKYFNEELHMQQEEILTQRDAIEDQNKLLNKKNLHINQSIQAAKLIQEAMLPFKERMQQTLPAHFVLYKPKDIVSGDFYWLEKMGKKIILGAFDCTGHGVPGAFMSLVGVTLLNDIVQAKKITTPSDILNQLRVEVHKALRQEHTGDRNGMDAAIVCLEPTNGQTKVTFAGAKRPLWYIAPSDGELKTIKGCAISIGVLYKEDRQIKTHEVICTKNTLLYIGSDGFTDQNNVKRKKIGRKRLGETLYKNRLASMNQQRETLEKALQEHMVGTEQRDDILLIGLKIV